MTIYVSDKLQATAATVSGDPTPTTSWQWLRNSSAISGATSSDYVVSADDVGANISVIQSAINMLGTATATSASDGPVQAFTPSLLFRGSTAGTWYEPADMTTLFRDAAGTQPVTAVEQPVGLMLDKSKGLVLGPELVTNGDFSNGTTGWVTANGGAVVNSRCECTTASNFLSTTAAILTVGKWYSAEFDYFMTAGAKLRVATKDTVGPDVATIVATSQSLVTNAVTRLKIKFQAAVGGFFILQASDATFSGWVDNISVRELPGNHAFNSSGNSANFPVLSARYNLLTKTEQFDDAAWRPDLVDGSTAPTVTADVAVAPDGTVSADQFNGLSSTLRFRRRNTGSVMVVGVSYKATVYVKRASTGSATHVRLTTNNTLAWNTGGSAKVSLTDEWQKLEVTWAHASGSQAYIIVGVADAAGVNDPDCYGNVLVWGADLRVANDALNQPAYQRVNTSTDYDTVGFKPYLRFNGTNQWLQTNSIDFTYGDKMFVSAGVRKLSDAAIGAVLETSANSNLNNGAIWLLCPGSPALDQYSFRSKGTSASDVNVTGYAAPITNVLSGIGNISGDQAILRVNGTQAAISTADQGTGNYGNYPLYIGARAGTSLWFNGRLYSLVVAGKLANAVEITETEKYVNGKTAAY